MVTAGARHGLRTVLHSRPGYSGSSAQPGRNVAAVAADVTAILDDLGAAEFVTIGWSGGGPPPLACAALLTGRRRAGATIAGVAPHTASGLDWLAGMGPENLEEFAAAAAGEAELTQLLTKAAAGLAQVRGDELAAELGGLASAVDRDALTGAFADNLAA